MLDSIALELVSIGGTKDLVARDLGGDNLANNILVSEADNETILGCVVFVLGLSDETLAGVVVGLSCSATLVLGLEAAMLLSVANRFKLKACKSSLPIVGAVLDQLGERLCHDDPESAICASDSIPKHLAGTHFHTWKDRHELEHRLTMLTVMPCCRCQAVTCGCVVLLDQSLLGKVCGHQISLAFSGG